MLNKFEIQGTRDTPEIIFNPGNKQFEIKGNSLPEDSNKFYNPVLDWLDNYALNPLEETKVICKLEYFNSSTAKVLYEIFFGFQKIHSAGKKVQIDWYYDAGDTFIEDKGTEYKSILDLPFNLIEK